MERHLATSNDIEQGLQGKALNAQAQFALTQLNPMGQQVVLFVDLVCQFTDILQSFLPVLAFLLQSFHLVDDTVDERHGSIDERHLSSLFQVTAFVPFNMQRSQCHLFPTLFQELVQLIIGVTLLSLVQIVEEP